MHISYGTTHGLPDAEAFVASLHTLAQHPCEEARHLFSPDAPLFVTRAPGRLDVMGGIADYSGSLVLELPTREATLVALQKAPARKLAIVSLGAEANHRSTSFSMPLADLERDGTPICYEAARRYFQGDPAQRWAAYVAGVFLVLMHERGAQFGHGARILISSQVPEGKGVSSSAALEVAVMQAVAAAFGITLTAHDAALLCQRVENLVVGAPCGVMDQITAAVGEDQRLLSLLCQPAELQGMVALPDEVAVWGIDSGVRHAVTGADYGAVRVGAFMGYTMIARLADLQAEPSALGAPLCIDDPRWRGYLANMTPTEFEEHYAARLPETMQGCEFLARYGGTTDSVTRVQPDKTYAVRVPAAHPVYENARVREFAELLNTPLNEPRMRRLGELMFQSHASYSACGLGTRQTDRLVELVRAASPEQGLYGAKITGGGSGGTVAVLGRANAASAVEAIAAQYGRETGREPHLFQGSSPGAAQFGYLKLERA